MRVDLSAPTLGAGLVALGMVLSGATAWGVLNAKADEALAAGVLARADHDAVISDKTRIDLLTTALTTQNSTDASMMRTLTAIREDIASLKAQVTALGAHP